MKIILNKEVAGLGEEGDVLVVSDGYARNFLFPSKQAVMFNTQNISVLRSQKDAIEKRKKERRITYMSIKEQLEGMTLVVKMKTGESGHLFGAVTSTVIADELEKQGIDIFKKQILVPHHSIKEIGSHEVDIKLLSGIVALLKVEVEDIEGKVKQVADYVAVEQTEEWAEEQAAESRASDMRAAEQAAEWATKQTEETGLEATEEQSTTEAEEEQVEERAVERAVERATEKSSEESSVAEHTPQEGADETVAEIHNETQQSDVENNTESDTKNSAEESKSEEKTETKSENTIGDNTESETESSA